MAINGMMITSIDTKACLKGNKTNSRPKTVVSSSSSACTTTDTGRRNSFSCESKQANTTRPQRKSILKKASSYNGTSHNHEDPSIAAFFSSPPNDSNSKSSAWDPLNASLSGGLPKILSKKSVSNLSSRSSRKLSSILDDSFNNSDGNTRYNDSINNKSPPPTPAVEEIKARSVSHDLQELSLLSSSTSTPMDELEDLAPEMVDPFHRSSPAPYPRYNPRVVCRNVSFDSVDIREYDVTVGDNPSCHSGPPVSLDWHYSRQSSKNLDEYEAERQFQRSGSREKFYMNKYTRRHILAFEWGHSLEEMKEARKGTKKMQRNRNMTLKLMPLHKAEEVLESNRVLGGLMKNVKTMAVHHASFWADGGLAVPSGEEGTLPRPSDHTDSSTSLASNDGDLVHPSPFTTEATDDPAVAAEGLTDDSLITTIKGKEDKVTEIVGEEALSATVTPPASPSANHDESAPTSQKHSLQKSPSKLPVILDASVSEREAVEDFMNSPSSENWKALVNTVQQRRPSERSLLLL